MAIVTFEVVAAAAEVLQAAGQRASVRAVTAAIGGGSPNTVLKMLTDWKAGRPIVRIADTELDQQITTSIINQMKRVATSAAAAAEDRAAAIDEDLQALVEAQAEAEQQIAALNTERNTAQAQAADFVEQLKDAQSDADHLLAVSSEKEAAMRLDALSERAKAESALQALAKAEVRLEALPTLLAEIDALKATVEKLQNAQHVAEQAAAVAIAKLEAMTERATKADLRSDKFETQAQQAMQEISHAKLQVQAQQAALDTATREISAAKEATKEAKAKADAATSEAAESRGKLKALQPETEKKGPGRPPKS